MICKYYYEIYFGFGHYIEPIYRYFLIVLK